MNLLVAWKKVLLFGAFGAIGCLAGWLVGELHLQIVKAAIPESAGQAPSLISKPVAPTTDAPPPPSEFRDRLNAAGAKSGDVQISLIWFDENDLDLHCFDPSGFEICWKPNQRYSARTKGELDVDRNAGCRVLSPEPVENIYWAKGNAPMGRYRVYLDFYQQCGRGPAESTYKINVLHGGERKEFSGTIARRDTPEGGPMRLIYEFQLNPRIELLAPAEFEVAPGATAALKVPVAIRREFFQGPVTVKAEGLPTGVTAEPLTLNSNQSEGELLLKATDAAVVGKTKIKLVATGEGVNHSADPQLAVVAAGGFSLWVVISIGIWTALLTVGLAVALVAGQNKYLGKPLFASGRVPLVLVILGAAVAGFVSGTVGQALFFVFFSVGVAKLGTLLGWMLLGALVGAGVSFFVPNLDAKKAALAGLAGGLLGAIAFLILSYGADLLGRFGGAALLGFCIGLMVAIVETAFRRAWLEVRFSEREVITVNLGPEPVKVGGDARLCTVWARGAADVALRYWVRDGKVHCEEVPTKREATVGNGDSRAAGNVTVVVRTANTPGGAKGGSPPPRPALPALPVPSAKPTAAPLSLDDDLPVLAAPPKPAPVAKPAPPPVAKPQAAPDYDDGLPMPMGPPPPARPVARSILDDDGYAPAKPAAPPVAKPAAPPVAKPQAVAPPAPPKPAAPVPPKPTVAAPPAPKPPAPVSGPKAGDPDACPSCGRKSPGKPGARYCMVCDKTF